MNTLLSWLPWIVGILIALLIFRFVVGLALRLIGVAVVVLVVYFVWQAIAKG